jgi:hypothetical protein
MGVENFANKAAEGQRVAKRARVLLAAKLRTPHGEVDARLRDLSSRGALVECQEALPVGTEVVFARGKIVVPARVAWTGTKRLGLEFHYPIDEHEVLVQLSRGPAATPEAYRRPALSERLTADERKLAQAWGVAVGLTVPEN